MRLQEFYQREQQRRAIRLTMVRIRERILSLEDRATFITTQFSDGSGGHSGRVSDRVGEAVAEIDKYKRMLADFETQLLQEEQAEERAMMKIGDPYVRMVLMYKYVDGLSWTAVAGKIGGASAESLGMMCKRYLEDL